jgi:hypothetical protein
VQLLWPSTEKKDKILSAHNQIDAGNLLSNVLKVLSFLPQTVNSLVIVLEAKLVESCQLFLFFFFPCAIFWPTCFVWSTPALSVPVCVVMPMLRLYCLHVHIAYGCDVERELSLPLLPFPPVRHNI